MKLAYDARALNYWRYNIMKYEVMLKVEAISKNSPSVINSLMEKACSVKN